ncbi:S9 family peptidase [Planosporangium thailandense]|uniref:prolyl oligopeptidase n=1 Tax=Planosporangium thailandense TaxID=765197 RepID=A0ABX0Y4N8_9ACTN|nr:S9 family peptidase [Planosporangium thailandense]
MDVLGGRAVADPYRWLEDADDPRTREWLDAQADLYERARASWADRPAVLELLHKLTAFDLLSVPRWRGGRAFYTRLGVEAERVALLVAEDGSEPRTLIDPAATDPTGETALGAWAPSVEGTLLAYELAVGGTEEFALRVRDVDTGVDVDGPIPGCRYTSVAWLPGGAAFYYWRDRGAGPRVYLHELGADPAADAEVFHGAADAEEFDLVIGADGRWLVITATVGLGDTTQVWVADLAATSPDRPAMRRLADAEGGWTAVWPHRDGLLYLFTDTDAPRGRILVVDPTADPEVRARTLVAEDAVDVIESLAIVDDLPVPELLVWRARAGRSVLTRHRLDSGATLGEVTLPGRGIVSELAARPEGGPEAWFRYSDRLTPETVYHYDARTGACAPWRAGPLPEVPAVVATETTYRSADGTPVRLLLLGPREDGTAGHAPRPTIVQAYGAFGEPQVADYYAAALAWAAGGGLFAVACVRGGGEEGEEWHRAGAGAHKQQGIDDFLGAGEYLIKAGYTQPGGLGAFGQSAGGLLVAAALTQRPDLFAAVACTAPLTDMARYELSGLGEYWREEFGRRDQPAELEWLLGYSPYHRVVPDTGYPAVLLTAFADDGRVDAGHARKLAAALQHATAAPDPILLHHEAGVGHGERTRSGRLAYYADVVSFFAAHLRADASVAAHLRINHHHHAPPDTAGQHQ